MNYNFRARIPARRLIMIMILENYQRGSRGPRAWPPSSRPRPPRPPPPPRLPPPPPNPPRPPPPPPPKRFPPPPPKPPGRSVLGFASLILRVRPPRSVPFKAAIAFS